MLSRLMLSALLALLLAAPACKSKAPMGAMPPDPSAILNNTRNSLGTNSAPGNFRFDLNTDPLSPNAGSPFMLRVHLLDGANQPADSAEVTAEVSSPSSASPQHLSFSGRGSGDYETQLSLDSPGVWYVDVAASRDGRSAHRRFTVEVAN